MYMFYIRIVNIGKGPIFNNLCGKLFVLSDSYHIHEGLNHEMY